MEHEVGKGMRGELGFLPIWSMNKEVYPRVSELVAIKMIVMYNIIYMKVEDCLPPPLTEKENSV